MANTNKAFETWAKSKNLSAKDPNYELVKEAYIQGLNQTQTNLSNTQYEAQLANGSIRVLLNGKTEFYVDYKGKEVGKSGQESMEWMRSKVQSVLDVIYNAQSAK